MNNIHNNIFRQKNNKLKQNKDILIDNVRILDPKTQYDKLGQLIIRDNKILDFGVGIVSETSFSQYLIIHGNNRLLVPGLLDIQVHFRDPGFTYKEDIITGSKAAVAGGITTVVCQPNTKPVIDSEYIVEYIQNKTELFAYNNVEIYAAVTKNMQGEQLSDMRLLLEKGVVGFTDDGLPVADPLIMKQAFMNVAQFGGLIAQHAEDLILSNKGAINEGKVSYQLGINGIPNASESIIVARDIELLRLTQAKYHVLHVSARETLNLIEKAKQDGLDISCEVTPHHYLLTDEEVLIQGTNAKMNPPLRTQQDREKMIQGIKQGTIDAIATDHAPHDLDSKSKTISQASFGIVGVETMLPLALELHYKHNIELHKIIGLMTHKPANIIGVDRGVIAKDKIADLALIDLETEFLINKNEFFSKSINTPFHGRRVKGRADITIVNGVPTFIRNNNDIQNID